MPYCLFSRGRIVVVETATRAAAAARAEEPTADRTAAMEAATGEQIIAGMGRIAMVVAATAAPAVCLSKLLPLQLVP